MSNTARKLPTPMTVDEFVAWPGDGSDERYELVDGELRAMAPATNTHGIIQANVTFAIRSALLGSGRRCAVVTEPAVHVRVQSRSNLRVPDIGVTCAPDQPGEVGLTDPVLLVEIMSPGNKAEAMSNVWAYATIPSLIEILVVQSTRIEAEVYRRQADGSWPDNATKITDGERLVLTSVGLDVMLRDTYAMTYLDKPAA